MSEPIAVTGATGAVGGRVARRLADRGVRQRMIVRDASRAPDLPGAEVAIAAGYSDPEAMITALRAVPTLFLVSGREQFDRVTEHRAAVDAAIEAGVERIVYLSFMAAAPDATFTFARDHFATEEYIRASGLRHTFLRSSLYLDFMPYFAGDEGIIRGPAGNGRFAPVARDDIADVAVGVLISAGGEHDGMTYDMTGREWFTMAGVAERLTELSSRPVRFVDETLEEARASRAAYGAAEWEVEGWITSYAAIATGEMAIITDTVRRLAEHEPLTLEEFVDRYPESLAQLAGD